MWATVRWVGVAGPGTRYTPAAPAWTGLVLLLLARLWAKMLRGSSPLSPVDGLLTLCVLLVAWVLGFTTWAVLRARRLAPDAPRVGFDLALWGLVARETSTVALWFAVPDPFLGAENAPLPASVIGLAQWTNGLGLIAFGWGMALGFGGCVLAARQRRMPHRHEAATVE